MSKLAVITGTSRGLGLILAQEFAVNGWRVAGTGRSERPAGFPPEATYHQFDASDWKSCQQFWERIQDNLPDVELSLINNAGGYVSGSLLQMAPEDYAQQMNSIYFPAVYMTRGLAMVAPRARIVNIISNSALAAHKNNSAYGAAKAAEMHFFQALQQEFDPGKYKITNLYPSNIATHGPNQGAIQPEDLASFVRDQIEIKTSYYLRDATIFAS